MQDSRKLQEKLSTFAIQMAYTPAKFGPNVKSAREKQRLTQQQVAERAGVAVRTFVAWEHGDAMPRGYNLDRLARVLKVDPSDLLEGVNDGDIELTPSEQLAALAESVARIESKLDAVLSIFTDADELAAAIDRRRAEPAAAPGEYEGLLPRAPGSRAASAPKRAARRAKTS